MQGDGTTDSIELGAVVKFIADKVGKALRSHRRPGRIHREMQETERSPPQPAHCPTKLGLVVPNLVARSGASSMECGLADCQRQQLDSSATTHVEGGR